MATTLLAVSDVRGDLEYLARVLDLAVRKDVAAQAIFIHGNFLGTVITPEEKPEYLEARKILEKELLSRKDYYGEQGVRDIAALGFFMTMNPAAYRRQGENTALRSLRVILGLKDRNGRLAERGRAALRARRLYEDAEKLFKRAPVPVYVLGDTIIAEDIFPPARLLHFCRLDVGGLPVRAVTGDDPDDADGLREIHLGGRREHKPVDLDAYPLHEGIVAVCPQINPLVHEFLSQQRDRLVITSGGGPIDLGYAGNVVSPQRPGTAYVYRVDGRTFVRHAMKYQGGAFGEAAGDDVTEARLKARTEDTQQRRRELEERAKLAGFGTELVRFIDLMRTENPGLAAELANSKDRVEVVLKYVREVETQRQLLRDVLGAERVGLSRILKLLETLMTPEQAQRIFAAVNLPPDRQLDVSAVDAANVEVVRLLSEALGVKSPGS